MLCYPSRVLGGKLLVLLESAGAYHQLPLLTCPDFQPILFVNLLVGARVPFGFTRLIVDIRPIGSPSARTMARTNGRRETWKGID